MKSRQLANVLIKILGLSICLHAVPTFISGVVFALTAAGVSKSDITAMRFFSSTVGAGVEAVFGIIIIAVSQKIAGMMFKDSDE
jgi:hypothetical protein